MDILAVVKIQQKGARFVTGNYSYKESITSMLDDLHWPSLQQRRKQKRLTAFYKMTNNLYPVIIPEYIKPSSGHTRTHNLTYVHLQANYEQYKNSFLPQAIREWHSLPPDLMHAVSVDKFITRLQNTLLDSTAHDVFNCKCDYFNLLLTSLACDANALGSI